MATLFTLALFFALLSYGTIIAFCGYPFISIEDGRRNPSRKLSAIYPFIWSFLSGFIVAYLFTPTFNLSEPWIYAYFAGGSIFGLCYSVLCQIKPHHYASSALKVYVTLYSMAFTVILLTSSPILHHEEFRALLRIDEVKDFDANNVILDETKARYVDQALATKIANEQLSKQMGLGSRYKFDTLRIQSVDGHPYWVAPLVNKSFIRWFNGSLSPGYVMVSAEDGSNAELILDKTPFRYGDDGYYGKDNIYRLAFLNGYSDVRLGDSSLELRDSDRKPFWVISVLESKVGIGALDVSGILLLDPETGSIEQFSLNDIPSWIERVFPEDINESQLENWGEYIHGWWNAVFIGNDTIRQTSEPQLTYSQAGNTVWYTGMQSSGSSQEATMGFSLMDTRTGKTTFYRREGLTEREAMRIMQGAVQEAGYIASLPQPYMINGRHAYVSIMKDTGGNRQGFGLVAYDNRDIFAFGKTRTEARRLFINRMVSSGQQSSLSDGASEAISISGTVVRFALVRDAVIFTLQSDDKNSAPRILSVSTDGHPTAALTQPGDKVSVTFIPIDIVPQPVNTFKNTTLP